MFRGVNAASTPAENLPLSQIAALAPLVITSADETILPFSALPLDGKLAAQSHDAAPALETIPGSPAAGKPGKARPFASLRASSERSEGIGLSLSFNDRRAPQGRVLTGTLAVIPSPAGDAGKTFDVAIDLPPGLDFVASADKGVTYDAAQRAVIMTGLDTSRASQRGRAFTVLVGGAPALSTLTPQVRALNRADGQAFAIKTASLLVPGGGEKTRIDAKGGSVSVAGGAARLDFGPGALHATQIIEASLTVFTPPRASAARTDAAAAADDEASSPDNQQPIWSITLSPDLTFETPVTLTTNISGFVPLEVFAAHEAVLEMRYVYTAWVTRTLDTGEVFSRIEYLTQEMPVTLDEATGEVTARLWHFSTYDLALAQPAAPKPWTPSANAPNVALFRGAATYQQPLPALPSFGLEPKLAASYSSASAESNFLQTSEPAMKYQLGRGWSLDLPHIAQLVKRDFFLGNPPEEGWRAGFETEARGNFTLVMNGMSVGLKPTGVNGEYVSEDSQALRVVRCAKASPCAAADQLPGITHSGTDWDSGELEYWQVWTPDGTRYVFGSETTSRAAVQDWDYNWCWNGTSAPGCGSAPNGKMIGMVWMLRRVYAPDRDLLSASVDRWGAEYQYTKTIETGSRCAMANWNTQICGNQDDPRIRPFRIVYGNSLLGASERYTVTFGYSGDKVTEVTAYEPGNRPAERARLSYVWVPFYGVGDELSALTSEAYTGTAWVGLPATTFAASQVSNLYNGNGYGPDPKRLLSRVENGLGARWNFTYQPDTSGYHASFRVTSRSVVPAGTGPATIESYTYNGGCYNWPDQPCSDPSRSWASGYTNWAMGYGQVTRTVMDEAGVPLAIEAHRFYTDAKRMGREYETRYRDGSGTVLSAKQSDIVTVTLSAYPTTTWQVRTTETREYPFGDIGSAPVRRIRTDAFTALGSPKTIQEYGFEGAGDERTTFIGYVKGPVAGEAPVWEALYSGILTAEVDSPTRLSSTRLYYDNAEAGRANTAWTGYNVYSQTLSRGRLTAVEHGMSALGGQPALWSMANYGYDALGNLAVLTDAGLNVSSVNYDGSGQFVLGSHNALGQVASYAYYGVNGESLTNTLGSAQPYGALKSTTDPNGAVVLYAYDALGRLRKVAQPGDSLADPSEEWRYYDGIETAWTTTATGFSTGPYLSDHLVRGVSGGGWTSSTLAVMDRTIYDGLGRAIQTQTRAGQGWAWSSCNVPQPLGSEVIQSTLYDALGRAAIQTVPYTQTQYQYCTTAGRVNAPYVAVPQTQTVPNGTGLAAAYYNGTNFDTLILEKTDATINFNWYGGSPYPGIINDNQFSARWTGFVRASTSETYTVYATGDDGIRLWVNGQLLVDQWHLQGATEYSATMTFQAGAFYELQFDYFENNDGAEVYLKWASPTVSKRIIPTANLYRVRPYVTALAPQTMPSGTGLTGAYFNGKSFETQVLERTDATINFNWYGGSPAQNVVHDNEFSAHWTGYVRADTSETYTIYAAADDGIRLWVNGQLRVDQWHNQGLTEYSTTVTFQAGGFYPIQFDYFENTDGAEAYLTWASPTVSKRIIPAANLYPVQPYIPATLTVPYARMDFDGLGRPITVTAPDGTLSVVRYEVDVNGADYTGTNLALKTAIDPNGHQKQQVSDGLGRLIRVREFDGTGSYTLLAETRYAYDAADRLTMVTDTLGNVTTITYDALGRKVGMVDPDMGAWSYGYNALGQLTSQTDAKGQTMVFSYDALGRMTAKTARDSEPMVLEAEGRYVAFNTGCGTIVTSTTVVARVGSCGGAIAYAPYLAPRYAGPGQTAVFRLAMTSTQNVNDPTVIATLDVNDATTGQIFATRDLKRSEFGGGIDTYRDFELGFDTTGRDDHQLEYRVWLKNNETIAHDRTTILWQQPLGQYLYDQGTNGIGRRSRMTDTTGLAWWSYDTRGRVSAESRIVRPANNTYTTSYGYDAANRLITTTHPGNEVVTNTYDAAGQPFSLFAAGSPIVYSATHNALGQPRTVNFGNGLSQRRYYGGLDTTLYVQFGKMRQLCVAQTSLGECADDAAPGRGGTGTTLFNAVYGYDAVGNITTIDERTPNLGEINWYQYDALDRLTEWQKVINWSPLVTATQESYRYNAIGNLTGRYGLSATGALTYPAAGSPRPHAATATASGNTCTYDQNGNMTVRREASISGTFIYTQTWTVDNRLASVVKASLTGTVLAVTQYAYDGDGVRIRKTDPDGTTLYIGLTEVTLNYTPPTLTGNTGVSADGFDLRKAATTYVWDAGAFDGAHAITQTGFVQTRVDTRNSGHRMFGLSNVDADVSFCSMRHAWFLAKGGGLWVYENCAAVYTATITYGVNDQLRIEVEGGYVRYKIQPGGGGGWQTLFTSTQPVTAPLYFDSAFLTLGSTLKDIRFVSGSTSAVSVNRTYYAFSGARVAMRDGAGAALVYLHGDQLGSASLATTMTGTVLSQQRYKPYGEIRWTSGAGMPTDFTFTSQRAGPAGYVGSLMDYVARGYSPALGRFVSADTIVPGAGNPQAFNRYMYVLGNPLSYIDPSGHMEQDFGGGPATLRKLIDMHYSGYFDSCYRTTCQAAAASIWFRQHPDYQMGRDPELLPGEAGGWVTLGYLDNKMRTEQMVTVDDLSTWAGESMATWFDTGGAFGYAGGIVSDIQLNGGTGPSFGGLKAGAQQQACSFTPDTNVTTEAGLIPIASVITGTRVLAWDETANTTDYYPVTNVWVHWDPVLLVLIIDGETITTTPEHPFYTPMHGWLPAGDLWVGAGLRRASGGAGIVESTMTVTRTERMWNLTVDVAHTYFVGVGEWLVHNAGGCQFVNKGKAGVDQARQEIEIDGGTWLVGEVTFNTPTGRTTRFDGAYLDSKGKPWLLEVKNGPTAKLTVNQQAAHPEVAQGRSTPVGANAELAGYEPNKQVGPQRIHYINYR